MGDKDSKLIRELQAGKETAFDAIFKKYYSLLCIEARGYFKNHFLIEEIVCDVFTKFWQNRNSLKITSSLREYLIKAVHNNCINYYRSQKVQEKLKQDVDENQKKEFALIDLGQNPLEYTLMNELQTHISKAISELPVRYRQAFELSRFENMTYEEIAREMGISVDGVKMNIKKALGHLREKLLDYLMIAVLFFTTLF